MLLGEVLVKCHDRLRGEALPDIGCLAALAVDGRFALVGVAVVVVATVIVGVGDTEILTEFQRGQDGKLQEGGAEPVDALYLVACVVDVCGGVGGEPAEILGGGLVHRGVIGGREDERRAYHAAVVARCLCKVGGRAGKAGVGADLEPREYLAGDVDAQREAAVAGILDDTVLVGPRAREHIPALLVAAAHAQVVLLRETVLIDEVLPVGGAHLAVVAILVAVPAGVEEVFGRGIVRAGGVVEASVTESLVRLRFPDQR